MRVNAWIHRTLLTPQRASNLRVHLGPGRNNYLPAWVNVDANFVTAKCDIWADLRYALPFKTDTVSAFYSHHVIEHLPDALLSFHFEEMFRCLRLGGWIRIGVPHAENAMKKYLEGDSQWFSDFPDNRNSIGGRFANFLLCRGEHLSILTPSYLRELCLQAGFSEVHVCAPVSETNAPSQFDASVLSLEYENNVETPHTLVVEARK